MIHEGTIKGIDLQDLADLMKKAQDELDKLDRTRPLYLASKDFDLFGVLNEDEAGPIRIRIRKKILTRIEEIRQEIRRITAVVSE